MRDPVLVFCLLRRAREWRRWLEHQLLETIRKRWTKTPRTTLWGEGRLTPLVYGAGSFKAAVWLGWASCLLHTRITLGTPGSCTLCRMRLFRKEWNEKAARSPVEPPCASNLKEPMGSP